MPPRRTESPQGHELTMALHVLGPVLMTQLLRPRLAGHDGRVLFVTSGGMYGQRLRADDPEFTRGEYSGTTAYARSKRAQVELLPVLAERWRSDGIAVHATHPGWADTPGVADSLPTFRRITGPLLRDAEGGSDTTVWLAATDPQPPSGHLWHDRRARPTHLLRRTRTGEAERTELWQWVHDQAGIAGQD
jgi:NAD(P)-dependent dehydrogenase (short-subunit alcohol dehydrogenase family)